MLLDFAKIPVEPVANMRGGQGTVLLQKTVQGPVKVMRGVLPPGATIGMHSHETNCEMIYILSGLTGLLILVALFTFIHKRRHSEDPETIVAPPADCCGAHAICEKGLKKASPQIDYFDDEELDVYRQIAPEAYTDEQIEVFRDILYTLRPEEVEEWLISLEKREINLPLILRQEAIELIP